MKAVIFGSKSDKTILSDECIKICEKLVDMDYDIYTGGGGGIMEAANKAAFNKNKIKSFGITTRLIYDLEKPEEVFYPNEN